MSIDTTNRPSIRLAAGLAILGTALLGASASAAETISDSDPALARVQAENAAIAAMINHELGLENSRLVELDIAGVPGEPMSAAIDLDGQWVTLDLEPHSVRSLDYQLYTQADDGSLVPELPGVIRTLRGRVLEMPGSFVAGSLLEDGLQVMIDPRDGTGRYWLEPAVVGNPAAAPGTYVIYRDDEMTAVMGECGTVADAPDDEPQVGSSEGGIAGGGCVDLFVTELACDTDFEYFQDYGSSVSSAEAQINNIINVMNNQYETQTQLTHEITTLIVRNNSNDPYSNALDAGIILSEFRNHWLSSQGGVQRDVAQIFTGKSMSGSTIGIAWGIGQICTSGAYCVSENIGGFGCRTDLSAHELGHLWGNFHCSGGCGTTMNSGLNCANIFNSTSINSTINHRNSRTCLVNECIPNNDQCANAQAVPAGATGFDTSSSFVDGSAETLCNVNGSSTLEADIWFEYLPPCTGTYTIDLCASSYNTRVAVYEFSCPDLVNQAIACDDDSCGSGGTRSLVTFDADGGIPLFIRVAGFEGASGAGVMDIIEPECIPAPSNDGCGNSTTVGLGSTPYSSIGATTDGFGEASCDGTTAILTDVWFRYFALADGVLTIEADGDYDTKVAVYSSCPTGANQAIACNDDAVGLQSALTIPVSQNTLYRIRVGSADASTGSGTLTLSDGPVDDPCPGDTNGDDVINVDDIVNVVLDFGSTGDGNGDGNNGDVDLSGLVDVDDIVFVVLNFGNTCP